MNRIKRIFSCFGLQFSAAFPETTTH